MRNLNQVELKAVSGGVIGGGDNPWSLVVDTTEKVQQYANIMSNFCKTNPGASITVQIGGSNSSSTSGEAEGGNAFISANAAAANSNSNTTGVTITVECGTATSTESGTNTNGEKDPAG